MHAVQFMSTLAMEKKIAGKRSMECKKLDKPRKWTIEILPSGVGDFTIL
jgi:hypothetical protein